jgi:dihydrofolate synthase / folylpolyglutamate synthase
MVRSSDFDHLAGRMKPFNPWSYLAGLNVDVMHFGLTAITQLLSRLDRPQNAYSTVLIAGTNGKGSTAAMLASILQSAGLKVGLYTSPHLIDIRERIVINGQKISRKEMGMLIEEVRDHLRGPVTYFEFLTAIAFLYFARCKVDIAVLEAGLGGRLDATNVSRPLVSVITNIALEHTVYLGKTLTAIAGEKAGIIKKNGICVTAARQQKVIDVFNGVCKERHAELFLLGRNFKIKTRKNGCLSYEGLNRNVSELTIPLLGRHQLSNTALALAAIEVLEKKGYRIDDQSIHQGLAKTHWEGRLEILQHDPMFLLDGAHNPAGVRSLRHSLEKDFHRRRLILIFGALADKDYRKMLRQIAPLADRIILPQLKATRAASAADLAVFLKKMNCSAGTSDSVASAVMQALASARKDDLICACGSLYLAGEVKQVFSERVCCVKTSVVK